MKAGWEVKPLESCLDDFRVPAKIQRKQFRETGQFPIISQEADFINGYWDEADDVCTVDRPIVIFGDHTQVLKYVDFDFVAGADGVKVLNPKRFLEPKFLYYFVMAHRAPSLGYARHYRHIKDLEIRYPPLEEQQRIVTILDDAFEGLARARAHAEANLQSARELYESAMAGLFDEFAVAPPVGILNDVCELIVDCEHKTAPLSDSGYPSIRTPNIGPGFLIFEGVNRVSSETYLKWTRRAKPQGGDLILAREAPAGNVGVIPENETVCLGQRTVLIRPWKGLHPQFLADFLMHPDTQVRLLSKSAGATVQHINMRDIRGLAVPRFPTKVQQEDISNKVQLLRDETNRLCSAATEKIQSLDALRQSLLQKAFSGELT